MKLNSILRTTTVLAAMALPLLQVPCFAQQEVDPTWHDPWAVTTPTPAQSAKAAVQTQKPKAQLAETHQPAAHVKKARAAQPAAEAHQHKADTQQATVEGSF